MTKFQIQCVEQSRKLLKEYDIEIEFKEHLCREDPGLLTQENDVYLKGSFERGGHVFKLYIYNDEAGFFLDEGWKILESQDYEDSEELIRKYVEVLRSHL